MVEAACGIVQVIDSVYPASGGGGAEAQVANISRWLTRRGLTTTIIAPRVSFGPQQRHEIVDGVPVIRIRYPYWKRVGSAIMLLRLSWLLIRDRHQISAIHAHIGNNMAAVSAVVGRLLGKPVIVKMTGMTELQHGVLDPSARLPVRLKRRLLQLADGFQATSSEIAERLVQCGFDPDRVQQIPNAVDTERYQPRTIATQDPPGAVGPEITAAAPLTAVYVGRLEVEKGVQLLIEAWAEAFGGDPSVRLVVVGGGSLADALKAQAAELGCGANIAFVGHTAVVDPYLAAADFGVLASYAEGLSNTMLETLASGLPMIVSRVSGAEDFVLHGQNGWVFNPGDREALATRLRDVRATGRERLQEMGVLARRQVVARASMSTIGTRLLGLYGMKGAALHADAPMPSSGDS